MSIPKPSPKSSQTWSPPERIRLEAALAVAVLPPDEEGLDREWSSVAAQVREYVLRPGKRFRPALVAAGHALAGGTEDEEAVLRFAAGLELLHAFLLIHDDVADRAAFRRGGPALHLLLGQGSYGENQAVVAGDHLFARAIEVMLGSGLRHAARATSYVLEFCRHTAVGQHLDLALGRTPVEKVTLFQTLKVASLKTARYGFVGPLVAGALLSDGFLSGHRDALERVGRHAGLAFQLKDDLLGIVGDDEAIGKSGRADFTERKRTFPLIASLIRGDDAEREALTALWSSDDNSPGAFERARHLLKTTGGIAATERAIRRSTRAAFRALSVLPETGGDAVGARRWLEGALRELLSLRDVSPTPVPRKSASASSSSPVASLNLSTHEGSHS